MRALLALLVLCSAAFAAEPGTVSGTVFGADGLPAAGVEIVLRGRPAPGDDAVPKVPLVTDEYGGFVADVLPGTWEVLTGGWTTDAFGVAADQLSELLITLNADGSIARALIEAPEVVEVVDDGPVPEAAIVVVIGVVTNEETGAPLSDARVFVRGSDAEGVTDEDGRFTLQLPAGPHRLSIVRAGFSAASPDVVAQEGAQLSIALAPAAPELEEFVVLVPRVAGSDSALLDERKESSAVSDVLGSEQMARAGDSNAASALKRVSGLTVVGGKYVYVRGLGERYSSTLLNGANLPSPEPEKRVVPLDLFPTSMLDSVVIQKTFSPDMPAEFGGGVVRLRTKAVPDGPVAKIGLSGALVTQGTGQESLRYQGGKTDWLGIDDGGRQLPEVVRDASDDSPLEPSDLFSPTGYTSEELETFGEAMPNNYNLRREAVPPDAGLSLSLGYGKTWENGREVGVLLGGGWSQSWDQRDVDKKYYLIAEGQPELSHNYIFEMVKRKISLGGLLTFGGSPLPGQTITSVTLVSRKTDDEARTYEGVNRDVGEVIRVSRLRYIERMLISQQVQGEHIIEPLSNLTFNWRWTGSWAFRDEPDRREYRYDLEDVPDDVGEDYYLLSDRPDGNQRFFSALEDEGHDVGWDVTLPFANWTGQEMRIKAGGVIVRKNREVDTRRFKFMHKGPLANTSEVLQMDPEGAFSAENIGPDGFQFEETTRQTDNYTASQSINAAYGMVEIPILDRLEFMGGARVEESTQQVTTFELFNPDSVPVLAELKTLDVLPAATMTLRLLKDRSMAVRGGYGLTVSRPDFRELSPATFNDVTGGRQTFGNPELERALIHAADLRWEWYPTPTESVSAGVFFKRFLGPIEKVVIPSAQLSVSWANSLASNSVGVEIDGRKDFGFIHPALTDLWFAGNLTFIYSRIELDPEEATTNTTQIRAMEGQSPYVVNASVGYDNPDTGTNVALLYNVFGPRIAEVGALGLPDVIEMPFHSLNFVASQEVPNTGLKFRLKISNIVNQPYRFKVGGFGGLDEQSEILGTEFNLNISWSPTGIRGAKKGADGA